MNLGAVLTALQALGTVITTTFTTAENAVGQFAQRTSKAISILSDMVDGMDTLKDVTESALTAFTKWAFIDKFIQAGKETESQLIKLKTSMQDVSGAVMEYQRAVKFAAETPFAVNQVVSAAAMLRTFQFKPFEKLEKDSRNLMEVLGDMAGAMGMQISEAAHALNRAAVGEWEYLQNRWQISARMIPALKGLTSGTKEYKEAIVAYLAQQERFNNGMDLASKSITGLTSNIEDLFSNFTTIVMGVTDAENVLKGVTFYDRIRENLLTMYRLVSDESPLQAFQRITQRITNLDNQLIENTKKLAKARKQEDIDSLTAQKLVLEQKRALMDSELKRTRDRFEARSFIPLDKDLITYNGKDATRTESALNLLKKAGLENARLEDQRDFLMRQGVDPNALISQYEKLQTAARIIGQLLGATYTLLADQIVKFGAYLTNKFLDGANNFLDRFMNGAISIKNIVEQDTTKTADRILKGTERYTKLVSDYLNISADITSEKYKDMEKQIRKTLLGSEDYLTKRFMVFAIILNLMVEFIKIKFDEIVENNPILKLIRDIVNDITENIPYAFEVLGNAFKNFMEENSNLLDSFFPMLSEASGKIKDLGTTLKGEANTGGGAITNGITKALNMAVGSMMLMIGKTLLWEKSMLGVNNVFLGISRILLFFPLVLTDILRMVGELFAFIFSDGKIKPNFGFNITSSMLSSFESAIKTNEMLMNMMPDSGLAYDMINRGMSMVGSGKGINTYYTDEDKRRDREEFSEATKKDSEMAKAYYNYTNRIRDYKAKGVNQFYNQTLGLYTDKAMDYETFKERYKYKGSDPTESILRGHGVLKRDEKYIPSPQSFNNTVPMEPILKKVVEDKQTASADTLGKERNISFIFNNPSILDEKSARRLMTDAMDKYEYSLGA